MRQHYHEQLEGISSDLIEMTRLVESAMAKATRALLNADLELAKQVIADDDIIDAFCSKIDEQCVDIVALQAPEKGAHYEMLLRMRADVFDLHPKGSPEAFG